jgi:PAS domain S-box-containing protein
VNPIPFISLHRLVGRVHEVPGLARRHQESAARVQASKASEERFRSLIDEIDAVFWEAHPDTLHFMFVSRHAEQMLGYPSTQWLSDPSFWVHLIHPGDVERVTARCRALALEGSNCELEYRAIAADGRIVYLRNIVRVLRNPAGRARLLWGVMLDVSGHRAVEQRRAVRQEVAQIVAEAESVEEAAPRLLRAIGEGLGFEAARLWRVDPKDDVLRCVESWYLPPGSPQALNELEDQAPVGRSDGLPGRVWQTAGPVWIADVTEQSGSGHEAGIARNGFRGACGFPIVHGDDVFGVIELLRRKTLQRDEDLIEMMATVGSQIGQFLDRAELYERAHRIAEMLQQAFLPASLPEIPGVRVHAAYVPGTVESEIGGDWYDVFRLPDGRVAISVGDVVGHGLQAAVIMGQVRQSIRAAALEGHAPSTVLVRASSVLRLTYEVEGMATAVFGVFDPMACAFTYAAAGHPAPVLATPDDKIEMLATGSLPLGAQIPRPREDVTLTLPAGSLLLLYTDGLVEANKDVVAGETALIDAVRAELRARSADPARAILDRMLGGNRPADDIAILALSLDPAPVEEFDLSVPAAPQSLPQVRQALRRLIRALGVDADREMALQVAVGEAMNNAIEHAYGTTAGAIDVRVRSDGSALVVEIVDHGRWRPPRAEGRGHGLALMRSLAEAVEIDSRPSGTTVRLSIPLPAAPRA